MTRPKLPSHTEHDSVPRAPMLPPPKTIVPAAEVPARVVELTGRMDRFEADLRVLKAQVAALAESDATQAKQLGRLERAVEEQGEMMGKTMAAAVATRTEVEGLKSAMSQARDAAVSAEVGVTAQSNIIKAARNAAIMVPIAMSFAEWLYNKIAH